MPGRSFLPKGIGFPTAKQPGNKCLCDRLWTVSAHWPCYQLHQLQPEAASESAGGSGWNGKGRAGTAASQKAVLCGGSQVSSREGPSGRLPAGVLCIPGPTGRLWRATLVRSLRFMCLETLAWEHQDLGFDLDFDTY